MRNRLAYRVLSDESMRMWYEWVISRKVLMVERFPLRLRALGNSEARLDFGSHGTFIRSIELDNSVSRIVRHLDSSMLTALEQSLYLFVRECIHLEEMYYSVSEEDSEVNDLVFSALRKGCSAGSTDNMAVSIKVDDNNLNELCYDIYGLTLSTEEKEMFVECMYLAIQRSSNKLVGIVFGMDLLKQHDEWILLKSKLSPYLTGLVGKMSEWMLIEAVKEFPHLDRLQVILEEDNKLSDLSLAALMEYGRGLKKLCIYNSSRYRSQVSKEEMADMLLLDVVKESDEKCVWRRLRKGEISGRVIGGEAQHTIVATKPPRKPPFPSGE
eukprot:scaffold2953_cov187-Ochromonas_danica.AAC.12